MEDLYCKCIVLGCPYIAMAGFEDTCGRLNCRVHLRKYDAELVRMVQKQVRGKDGRLRGTGKGNLSIYCVLTQTLSSFFQGWFPVEGKAMEEGRQMSEEQERMREAWKEGKRDAWKAEKRRQSIPYSGGSRLEEEKEDGVFAMDEDNE